MKTALVLVMLVRVAAAQPFGGNSYGGNTYGGAPADAKAQELARCFEQTVADKIREGYYVKNDRWYRSIIEGIQGWNPLRSESHDKYGGRCGEYGERGMKWMRPCMDRIYGAGIGVVDDLFVEEKSTVRGRKNAENGGWSQYANPDYMVWEANHRATRVILPDGRRFMVDFWDGVSTGKPKMVPEAEWTNKWLHAVGDQMLGPQDAMVQRSDDEQALKKLVTQFGEEKGLDAFRRGAARTNTQANADVWIKSYQLDPW